MAIAVPRPLVEPIALVNPIALVEPIDLSPMNRFSVDLMRGSLHRLLRITLIAGAIAGALPVQVMAQEYVPPNRGLPGRREGGGTRGCWTVNSSSATPNLTAVVPDRNFGYTTQAHPSFFVYVPPAYAERAKAAEFVLSDSQGNPVYSVTFQTVPGDNPITRLDLPQEANVAPLAIGEDYQWSFSLICDLTDRSADFVVDSWIQRIEPDAALAIALQGARPEQYPELYAGAGIWYDALTSIVDLNRSTDVAVTTAQWQTLLNSVGLDNLAQPQSMVNSATEFPVIP